MNAIAAAPGAAVSARRGYDAGPIRDISIPLAALIATLSLPFDWIVALYIVIGQAHFVHAYLYQYRGKRMDRAYLSVAALLLAGFAAYFWWSGAMHPLLLLIGVLFSAHFAYDEITLHDETPTKESIASVVAFTAFFASFLVASVFRGLAWFYWIGIAIALSVAAWRFLARRTPLSKAERYLWIVEALSLVLALVFHQVNAMLGVIVLLHAANWYVGYGMRLRGRPDRARTYWTEVVVSLSVTFALFSLYKAGHAGWLHAVFGQAPYYAWATAHIVLSLMATLAGRARITG